jgi:type II secretory pathway component PulC
MSRAATTPREWALAIGGGLALALGLVLILRGGSNAQQVDAPVALTPPPAVVAPPAAPAAQPPPADLALAGLRAGPDGGMAIIISGGRQYLLRPGRSLPGGLQLKQVAPGHAILSGPGGEIRLGFPDAAGARPGANVALPGGDPTPWRLALRPLRDASGTLSGWRLDSLAGLPALARAGLKPGDLVLAANGTALISEEKVSELPQELAANGQLRLTIRRAGIERELTVQP